VEEISGKEDLHEAIWENIHRKRFYLAEEAPMCSGPLRGLFGYNSVTPIAKAILEGTYQYPPDFDEATKEILQECASIRIRVPKNSVTTAITPEDWTNHWQRAHEETSSSTSGRHFGHYGRSAIAICVLPPSPPGDPGREKRNRPGKVSLSHVGENIRLLADHQATINSPDGGRLQCDQ